MRTHNIIAVGAFIAVGACCGELAANSKWVYGGGFSLPIPVNQLEGKGWMQDAVIEVDDHVNILDLDIVVDITHTKVFDLQLMLKSPAGTNKLLNYYNPADEYFDGQGYSNTIFDDEASSYINEAIAPFNGRFKPRKPCSLSAFDGQDAFGQWRFRIYDAFYADAGTLNSVRLIISNPEPGSMTLFAVGAFLFRYFSAAGRNR